MGQPGLVNSQEKCHSHSRISLLLLSTNQHYQIFDFLGATLRLELRLSTPHLFSIFQKNAPTIQILFGFKASLNIIGS